MNVKKGMPELLYERIEMCLNKCTLTYSEIAIYLGISRSSLYNYRTGQSAPDALTIIRMCYLFNVSADWLLGIKEYEQNKGISINGFNNRIKDIKE